MQLAKLQTLSTDKTSGQVFISSHETSHPLGKLLIMININWQQLGSKANLDDLIEFVKKTYYEPTSAKTPDPSASLENLANKLNDQITNLLPDLNFTDINKNINFFIGSLKDEELFFSKTKNIKLFLQHGLNLINIADASTDEQDDSSNSLFSFITSGKLSSNDAILITTSSLVDYFSENKLKQILSDNSAEIASVEFTKLVDEFSKHTYFQGLIIKNSVSLDSESYQAKIHPALSNIAQSSMSELNSLESETGDLLTSSFVTSFKKSLATLINQIRSIFSTQTQRISDTNSAVAIKRRLRQKSLLNKTGNWLWLVVKSLLLVVVWVFKQLALLIKNLFKNRESITQGIKQKSTAMPSNLKDSFKKKIYKYKSLDKNRRTTLLVGLGLIIILIGSVMTGIIRKATTMSHDEVIAIFDEIEVKRASAEAALIYGNEEQAVTQIAEARRLLNDLSVKGSDLKQRKSDLADSLFESYKSVQKLEEINNPVLIADLGASENGQTVEVVALAGSGSTFYGYNKSNQIYKFSTTQQSVDVVVKLDNEVKGLNTLADNELLIYFATPEANIGILNTEENSLTNINFEFNNPLTEKVSLEPYFSRLYVLDPRERQIYKHQQIGRSYTRGQPWLVDDTADISDASSMAIDGNIWVTTNSGNLYKFNAGEREDFSLATLDPILNSPNFVWTSIDSSKLYILDPPTHRVIILNKDGTIHKQFVSERFDNLKSAVIDEGNDKIYILNSNQVYEIDIGK